jgi:hypothetical protein
MILGTKHHAKLDQHVIDLFIRPSYSQAQRKCYRYESLFFILTV